ncbi:AAA family ATPase [Pseudomonas aeruginosa]|nr:AAA family ATPase [Pseudomonas aeruginosa]
MKVLVLTGPESSGKSWLAEQLRGPLRRPGGRRVRPPLHRRTAPRRTCYADIPAIARGQLAWEDAARAERPALLILDTHLLSNILWSRILFGACPDWLEPALLRRRYDLHLLFSPEGVAWSADGQRCQPELAQRQAFHRECQAWLERHRQPYRAIAGDWAERRRRGFRRSARAAPGRLKGRPCHASDTPPAQSGPWRRAFRDGAAESCLGAETAPGASPAGLTPWSAGLLLHGCNTVRQVPRRSPPSP